MEKTIKTGYGETFYSDEGNGSPLVLLHGFCEDHTIWSDFKEALLSDYRVITPDLAGFGKSTINKKFVSIEFFLSKK